MGPAQVAQEPRRSHRTTPAAPARRSRRTEPMTATTDLSPDRITAPRVRVGLVAGGLGAYWPQFPDLLPQLKRSAERVSERMRGLGADVVDVGFISDAQEGAAAAERL